MIEVRFIAQSDPRAFEVTVRDDGSESRHHVTLSHHTAERLTASRHSPERCVEAAFRFLLEREPKESILARFDIADIGRYFPEFVQAFPRYLSQVDPGPSE